MCIDIYIYIYTHCDICYILHKHTHIHTHTDTRIYIHVHIHVRIDINIVIYIYVYIYIYIYTYIYIYMFRYIYIYIHFYDIIYECCVVVARCLCRVAWVVPKIPEGSISEVIGREVWEEGEARRALIKQEQDPPTNVGEFSRSNQKPHSGQPPSAQSAIEIIVVAVVVVAEYRE